MSTSSQLVGYVLGHYRILEHIGAGGMGVVYRARDEQLERDVAVKVLPAGTLADDAARKRFRKEALALAKLNHPNIAIIHDLDTQQGVDFLVMEYIAGVTLSEKLSLGPLPEKQAARLGVQLAEGLIAAHEQGVVHCDLKPSNLRVTPDGGMKILDFGLAKLRRPATTTVVTESISQTEEIVGTLPYMAPEQLLGEDIDARTDIHAAGAVLYEMVTGRRAFVEVERSQLISAILHRAPVPAARLSPRTSPEFDRIIEKCLEKDPENRYQSSKEVAVDLRRLFQPQTARVKELRKRPAPTGPLTAVGVLVVVASIGVFWARQHYQPEILPRGGRIMLAVLPFENRSGDPAQDYFGEGLTEEMISQLGRLSPKQLGVIARTSVMRYQHADKAIAQIGQELRVDYILDGGTRQVGDRVHVTAELIHAQDQTLLWSSSYERRVEDIFGLQNAVAISVAKALTVELLPAEQEALNKVRPINPQAHESYLRGRFHWSRLTGEELEKAREYFDETVKIDPTYSQAYVGLADYYRAKYSLPPKVAMTKAREYAQRALALDKTLPEAHLALAAIEYSDWNWLDAQQEFEWAVKLNPSYAEAHQAYSIFLSALGHINEAWKEIRTAQELDPLSVPINTTAGWIAYFARRNDLAIEQCKKALDLEPNAANAHDCLGSAYLEKRMYREAIHECQTAMTLSGQDPDRAVCLGRAHVAAGERRETVKVLQTMQAAARQGHTPPYFLGVLYAALKEDDQAFASLEESYRERDPYLVWIKVSPAVDPLRSDARFEDLLRRLAFPD